MTTIRAVHNASALIALTLLAVAAYADEAKFEVGVRANVLLGDGVPANDILGFGVISRYRLSDGWFVGFGLDRYEYDVDPDDTWVTLSGLAPAVPATTTFGRIVFMIEDAEGPISGDLDFDNASVSLASDLLIFRIPCIST